ncbi:unnamed protein product [Cyclocybe aegerita]|uniref:Uncharacterized protein n=1 Tax=Cyclocybe aegerita TaxID=1973307 RepID=A0A8S0X3V5_CYCAE|nr:unnamed protein product [Cyclocybe aegerita]
MASPLLGLLALLVIPVFLVLFSLWLWSIGRVLKQIPTDARAWSPDRWDIAEIRRIGAEVLEKPLDTLPYLPPATGRRYIVVGGSGKFGISRSMHRLDVSQALWVVGLSVISCFEVKIPRIYASLTNVRPREKTSKLTRSASSLRTSRTPTLYAQH